MRLKSKLIGTVFTIAAIVCGSGLGATAQAHPIAPRPVSVISYPVGAPLLGSLYTKVSGVGSGKSLIVYGIAKTEKGVLASKVLRISVKSSKSLSRIEVSTKTNEDGKFSYSVREIARVPGVYFVTVSYGTKSVTRAVTIKASR